MEEHAEFGMITSVNAQTRPGEIDARHFELGPQFVVVSAIFKNAFGCVSHPLAVSMR
jgi:hypothetical protein